MDYSTPQLFEVIVLPTLANGGRFAPSTNIHPSYGNLYILRVNKHKHALPVARDDWIQAVRDDPKGFCDYSDYDGYRISRTKIVSQLGCSLVTADKLKMILTPLVEKLNRLDGPERERRYVENAAAYRLKSESKTVMEEAAIAAKRKEAEEREKAQRLKWIEEFRSKNPGVKLPPMLQEWVELYDVDATPNNAEDPTRVVDTLMSGEELEK